MNQVTLYLSVLLWGILCGAVVYEHLAVIPVWASKPPESLAMWTGRYRVAAQRFWIVIHPAILVSLCASIAVNWGNPARDLVALTTVLYLVVVLAPTAVWFVPNLLRLTDPDAALPAERWRARCKLWERLSIVRGVVVLALIVPLVAAVEVWR
ncbi:MAG: hypothetical protein QM658_06280 [Gordonia sp. (in: high G+C Gram-positive bacteria)]